jgi:hypothetical protein
MKVYVLSDHADVIMSVHSTLEGAVEAAEALDGEPCDRSGTDLYMTLGEKHMTGFLVNYQIERFELKESPPHA